MLFSRLHLLLTRQLKWSGFISVNWFHLMNYLSTLWFNVNVTWVYYFLHNRLSNRIKIIHILLFIHSSLVLSNQVHFKHKKVKRPMFQFLSLIFKFHLLIAPLVFKFIFHNLQTFCFIQIVLLSMLFQILINFLWRIDFHYRSFHTMKIFQWIYLLNQEFLDLILPLITFVWFSHFQEFTCTFLLFQVNLICFLLQVKWF